MEVSKEEAKLYGGLADVFLEALKVVIRRNSSYGERWKEEPIEFLYQNVWRKAFGLRAMEEAHSIDMAKREEDFLDLINYAGMVVIRLRDNSSSKEKKE